MLSGRVRVLRLDESVSLQRKLLERYKPEVVDFGTLGEKSRLWASIDSAEEIKKRLDPALKNDITLLGSGDFHHVSLFLIEQFLPPISVIIFDHHPDWFLLPPKKACGSWVSELSRNPNIGKIVLFGPSSDDLDALSMLTADLSSLDKNKLEIYPYKHSPSLSLLRRVPDNVSISNQRRIFYNKINWRELRTDPLGIFSEVIQRLPSKQVYISIDKDCLRKEYALTNWEEGSLSLDELLSMLDIIKSKMDIAGLDITGDYSYPRVRGKIKSYINRADHPRDYTARNKPQQLINEINEETNLKILDLLSS